MTGPKKSPFTTEGYKRTAKTINEAGQDLVKLINTIDTNHKDRMLESELEKLREARYNLDHAYSLLTHANQIHFMRTLK